MFWNNERYKSGPYTISPYFNALSSGYHFLSPTARQISEFVLRGRDYFFQKRRETDKPFGVLKRKKRR